jgi:hypothetical protein
MELAEGELGVAASDGGLLDMLMVTLHVVISENACERYPILWLIVHESYRMIE